MTTVLLVDDHEDWRNHVRLILQARPQLQIVCEVSDGLVAVQKAGELQPDLILLDIGLPTLNGIEAALQISQRSQNSKIVFLSADNSLDVVQAALSTNAHAFVHKARTKTELFPAIDAVLRGGQFIGKYIEGYRSLRPSTDKLS